MGIQRRLHREKDVEEVDLFLARLILEGSSATIASSASCLRSIRLKGSEGLVAGAKRLHQKRGDVAWLAHPVSGCAPSVAAPLRTWPEPGLEAECGAWTRMSKDHTRSAVALGKTDDPHAHPASGADPPHG